MKRCCRQLLAALLVSGLAVAAAAAASVPPPGAVADTPEQIQFEQERAGANMRELEERMFRLSQLIQDAEPDHAARLKLALQKARGELLVDRMKAIRQLIAAGQFERAVVQQKEVAEQLEAIRKLLLATDMDLRLKLDRIKAMADAIARIDKLSGREAAHADASDKLDKPEKKDAEAVKEQKTEQERTRKAAEAMAETVKGLAGSASPATGKMGDATAKMSSAETQLGQGAPGMAQPSQQQATDDLQAARRELEKQRQQLLEEVQRLVRLELIENLTEMVKREKAIREASEPLAPILGKGEVTAPGYAGAAAGARRLADPQRRVGDLADRTATMLTEAEFSIAYPLALSAVKTQMLSVAERLDAGRADDAVVADEKRIEDRLGQMLEAMKEDQKNQDATGDPKQCKACKDMSKLLAELKVIRMLQMDVNSGTAEADGGRAGHGELTGQAREAVGTLARRQRDLQEAINRLDEKLAADQAGGGAP